jgi:SNF family Na+-dependent transporter
MKTDLENKTGFIYPWIIFLTVIFLISFIFPLDKKITGINFIFKCYFKEITGLPCPLCGMTRAFVSAANLDFGYAALINPGGLFLFIYLCTYLLCGWAYLIFNKKNKYIKKFIEYNSFKLIIIVISLSWLLNLSKAVFFDFNY